MLKIRRSRDRLIFNMGIPIPGKDGLYIETGPCNHCNSIHEPMPEPTKHGHGILADLPDEFSHKPTYLSIRRRGLPIIQSYHRHVWVIHVIKGYKASVMPSAGQDGGTSGWWLKSPKLRSTPIVQGVLCGGQVGAKPGGAAHALWLPR